MSFNDALKYKSQIDKAYREMTEADDKLFDELNQIVGKIVEAPIPTAEELAADPERLDHLKQTLELVFGEIHDDNAYWIAQWLFDTDHVFFDIQTRRGHKPAITFTVHTTKDTSTEELSRRILKLIAMIDTVYVGQMVYLTIKAADRSVDKEVEIMKLVPVPQPVTVFAENRTGWMVGDHDPIISGPTGHNRSSIATMAAVLTTNELYAN